MFCEGHPYEWCACVVNVKVLQYQCFGVRIIAAAVDFNLAVKLIADFVN